MVIDAEDAHALGRFYSDLPGLTAEGDRAVDVALLPPDGIAYLAIQTNHHVVSRRTATREGAEAARRLALLVSPSAHPRIQQETPISPRQAVRFSHRGCQVGDQRG
jgi:hypothetical protein